MYPTETHLTITVSPGFIRATPSWCSVYHPPGSFHHSLDLKFLSSSKASLSAAFNILTVLFNVLLLCYCTYVCNIRKHVPYMYRTINVPFKNDNILIFLICKVLYAFFPQHFLYFLPEPHGHGSFRPIFLPTTTVPDFFCSR